MPGLKTPLGLPVRYAALGAVGATIGYYLFSAMGVEFNSSLASLVLATTIGGFVGGAIQARQNRTRQDGTRQDGDQ